MHTASCRRLRCYHTPSHSRQQRHAFQMLGTCSERVAMPGKEEEAVQQTPPPQHSHPSKLSLTEEIPGKTGLHRSQRTHQGQVARLPAPFLPLGVGRFTGLPHSRLTAFFCLFFNWSVSVLSGIAIHLAIAPSTIL